MKNLVAHKKKLVLWLLGVIKGSFFPYLAYIFLKRGRNRENSPKLEFLSKVDFSNASTLKTLKTKKYVKMLTFDLL